MNQTELGDACDSHWVSGLDGAIGPHELQQALQAEHDALAADNLLSLIIVGAAPEGQRLAHICRQHNIAIDAVVDDDPAKAGSLVAGVAVAPVESVTALPKSTPVIVASHRLLRITKRLRSLGFQTVVPFATLQTLAPQVFRPHMFYDGLLEDLCLNRHEYRKLHERLADEPSRQVLDAVIRFRRTLDAAVLQTVVTEHDLYAPDGLFNFSDNEVYVDGGSYDGDTIRSFIDRVHGSFEAIYAFEPDPVTFEILKENFRGEARVHPFHAGLYSRCGKLRFRDDASRGAIFAADGDNEMPITTIDEVLGERRLSYVKMNIEGAEIDALRGGQRAIRKWRPRLAVSVYHRPTDLWRIPQLVLELDPSYELYLRQHDGGIIETVLYALHR